MNDWRPFEPCLEHEVNALMQRISDEVLEALCTISVARYDDPESDRALRELGRRARAHATGLP